MDGFDPSQAPIEYQAVKPLADLFLLGAALGWVTNYVGMVYTSFNEETYAMSILALCCNFAWEIVYTLIYPSRNRLERGVLFLAMIINFGIMYAAVIFSPREWTHAPLVEQNLHWIFSIGIIGFLTGHLALAAEIGAALAYTWGAVVAQLLLSVGGICQLLCRGSTRGASYALWFSRFFGSCSAMGFAILRWMYWPESFAWLSSPLILWSVAVFLIVDGSYGLCYWYVKRYEKSFGTARTEKVK
ncbi:hypothetical protein CBS147333_1804 [Penicillium roqueforti]|nr:hypothetical protein CBS147333_1804 [Penicillium roqueforti]KAI3207459.1 hypothetical protein CBS147311_2560 [Penicillium roqueforti]KAI3274226.1 hypothetical protein CBS147308_2761 [Penicillium roqueforti]KAI3286168.1 hypothetical protein DTO003C3_7032 [Penicillium roqueforti]KAI3299784.1 hypothetical protein DTO002I6_2011 [Penicillium roqueforti]